MTDLLALLLPAGPTAPAVQQGLAKLLPAVAQAHPQWLSLTAVWDLAAGDAT